MLINNNYNGIKIAAIFGFFGVMIGAMGAHALKPHLSEYQMYIFEKGVHYQFYHTLAILGVGLFQLVDKKPNALNWVLWLFVAGIFCFSGSLYLLACRDLIPFPVGWAGPVTPLGGLLFMGAWGGLFWHAHQSSKH
jgi:uncharacterized membrane protein YgdD (TMEM256/DUF423 family)